MTDEDYARKLGEVDRVLNDPDVPIRPALIWRLLAEISAHDSQAGSKRSRLTAGDGEDAGARNTGHWMSDQGGVAMVGDDRSQCVDQAESPVGTYQK